MMYLLRLCGIGIVLIGVMTVPSLSHTPSSSNHHTAIHHQSYKGKVKGWTNRYDRAFQAAVFTWYPADQQQKTEWMWLKAQAIRESGLRPDAVSPVGAQGLLQIMPATRLELDARYGTLSDPLKAHDSIVRGSQYMAWLAQRFILAPNVECRRDWQLAAYNAGVGRVRSLRVKAGGPECWNHTVAQLAPAETRHYVSRIHKTYHAIKGGG